MNILVTLDSNYIYPLSVMLRSLAANCPGSRIDLYVVYASLTEDDFSRMESALGGSDHEVHRIKVDDAIFSGFPVLDRISKATYYRLLIGEILPQEIDRVLYLDPDIVINRSLEEFYNLDLKGNILAGATHLFGLLGKINLLRLGIHKHTEIYINAGVLLIDLKKWRETVTLGQILTYISKKHRTLFLADQDVVNALFADHTLAVDERLYNLDEKTALHSLKTHEWIEKNCSIVHYNGKYKPWKEGYIGTLAYLWHREEKSLLADAQREL